MQCMLCSACRSSCLKQLTILYYYIIMCVILAHFKLGIPFPFGNVSNPACADLRHKHESSIIVPCSVFFQMWIVHLYGVEG